MRAHSIRLFVVALPLLTSAALFACGDDDNGTTPKPDGGTPTIDGATDGGPDSSQPDSTVEDTSTPKPELRCTQAELDQGDFTDAGTVEIVFNTGANPLQYTNHCAKLRVGAKVTFKGSFKQHPLEPAGGDEPSPIPVVDKDQPSDTFVVDLPKAGTFGYQCIFHPLAMFGVIQVVP